VATQQQQGAIVGGGEGVGQGKVARAGKRANVTNGNNRHNVPPA